jgi:hypothetical protein
MIDMHARFSNVVLENINWKNLVKNEELSHAGKEEKDTSYMQ